MKRIKYLTLILIFIMVSQLVACNSNIAENKNEISTEQTEVKENQDVAEDSDKVETGTRTIVDHAGNSVEVSVKIERIVIDQIPILSTYMAYHQG